MSIYEYIYIYIYIWVHMIASVDSSQLSLFKTALNRHHVNFQLNQLTWDLSELTWNLFWVDVMPYPGNLAPLGVYVIRFASQRLVLSRRLQWIRKHTRWLKAYSGMNSSSGWKPTLCLKFYSDMNSSSGWKPTRCLKTYSGIKASFWVNANGLRFNFIFYFVYKWFRLSLSLYICIYIYIYLSLFLSPSICIMKLI